MSKIKLLCLPHAGASSYYYVPLKSYINNIDIINVELKGRGRRFNEPHYESFDEVIDDIYSNINDKLDEKYAIFGHSMGSWLAFELYYKLVKHNENLPMFMFFSGREAPNIVQKHIDFNQFSDQEFLDYLNDMGGLDKELFTSKDILKMYLDIIRSDFKILAGYKYKEHTQKIKSDAIVLLGRQDEGVNFRNAKQWSNFIEGKTSFVSMEGGHFYMKDNWDKLGSVIEKAIG